MQCEGADDAAVVRRDASPERCPLLGARRGVQPFLLLAHPGLAETHLLRFSLLFAAEPFFQLSLFLEVPRSSFLYNLLLARQLVRFLLRGTSLAQGSLLPQPLFALFRALLVPLAAAAGSD